MSDKKHDGGPAFPDPARGHESNIGNQTPMLQPEGMSLRQWYAGMALATLSGIVPNIPGDEFVPDKTAERLADFAFRLADAMLERRAR